MTCYLPSMGTPLPNNFDCASMSMWKRRIIAHIIYYVHHQDKSFSLWAMCTTYVPARRPLGRGREQTPSAFAWELWWRRSPLVRSDYVCMFLCKLCFPSWWSSFYIIVKGWRIYVFAYSTNSFHETSSARSRHELRLPCWGDVLTHSMQSLRCIYTCVTRHSICSLLLIICESNTYRTAYYGM